MAVKQNSLYLAMDCPLAAKAVEKSFYVDDCLSGADTVYKAIELHQQLQKSCFLLRKWNVRVDVPTEEKDKSTTYVELII